MSFLNLEKDIQTYVKELPSSNSVTVGFFLDVSLPYESSELNGISHFLEHMCFRGTKNRTAYEITKAIDSLGGYINAYTSKEFTCYYVTILPENLAEGLDILIDVVFNSVFSEDDVKLEKSIIGEEIKMYEDTPDEKIMDMFNNQLFENSYLGNPILGTQNTISLLNSDKLKLFHQYYFSMSNVKCVVAGKILDSINIVDLLNQYFSKVNFSDQSDSIGFPDISFKSSNVHKTKTLEQTHLCFGFPTFDYNHSNRYPLTVLSTLLGGSMSSRLFQSVREKLGLAYSIYSYANFYKSTGSFFVYAGMANENLEKTRECIDNEIQLFLQEGISEDELIRAKRQLRGSIIINLEGSSAWVNWLGRQFIYKTGLTDISQIEHHLNTVQIEDVKNVAAQIFNKDKLVQVSLGK